MTEDNTTRPWVPISEELLSEQTGLAYRTLPDPVLNMRLSNTVGVRMTNDPEGSENQLVTLVRADSDGTVTVLGSALHPIREGSVIKAGEQGNSLWDCGPEWREMLNPAAVQEFLPHVWYVDIDGERIIEVPGHLVVPPTPPVPPVPWRRRVRLAISGRVWATLDRILARWGYSRGCDCDEY